jgi:hypothetical protein
MPRIFVSYRREDSGDASGRLGDGLKARLGRDNVFMDVDNIPVGVDFRQHLAQAVSRCDILLAVIGDHWLEARYAEGPKQGQRRLDDPDDYVRIEIQSALARNIRVVPVLVRGATMPRPDDLPGDLKPLAFRQAAEVRPGRDFGHHLERLIHDLGGPAKPRRRWPWLAAGLVALAALVGLVVFLFHSGQPDEETEGPPGSFSGSYVERGPSKEKEKIYLDSALPFSQEDRLHLNCTLPAGVQVAAFWFDSAGKLQELKKAQVADRRLDFPAGKKVVPLTGPPGTEFVLIAGSRRGPPSKEEVQTALGNLRLPDLPKDVKSVRLSEDKVQVQTQRGFGEEEPGVTSSVVERLETLRKALRGRYKFVAGLAFPHRHPSTKATKKHE